MTRWFTPSSLQFSSSSWNQSRFRSKKNHAIKHRHVKHYRILNELALGSTCTVYLALDTKSKKLYALKEMNLKKLQRQQCMDWLHARHPKHQQQKYGTKRRRIEPISANLTTVNCTESEFLHSLHHDLIVEWVDCFEENDNLYLVTEWVDGTVLINLRDGLGDSQTNENDDSLDTFWHCVFTQLVDVLEYLHEQNVIHGDIKPDNILLTKTKQIKLIDFGSAIKLDTIDNNKNEDDDRATTAFQKTTFHRRRTPAFTPPECIKKETTAIHQHRPHDITTTTKQFETAADIWSLGMTLYCMVYGKLPFDGRSENITVNKQMDLYHHLQNFASVPHNISGRTIDFRLRDLIDQMLKVSPMERITLKQIKRHPWFLGNVTIT